MHQNQCNCDDEPKTTNTLLKSLDAKRYGLIRQIAKHTSIDNQINQFGSDLAKLQNLTKSKINEIDSFISQKERLGNGADDGDCKDADKEVDSDINFLFSKRSILSRAMTECPRCEKRVLNSVLDEHTMVCSVIAKQVSSRYQRPLVGNISDDHTDQSNKFDQASIPYDPVRPKPPRNLRIGAVDFSSITIEWDTSIFDGGEPIVDYEVFYCMQPSPTHNMQKTNKKFTELCSRWCLAHPIPQNCFVIEGLFARTTYCDIKLRCKNKVGWSKFGPKIESAATAEPIRPPKPRYFEISNVTSSSMYLEWSPPFRSGGGTLEGYILSHFEPVDCETQTAGQEEKKVYMKQIVISLSREKTSFDLKDLKGDTLYTNFQLVAITNFGLKSDAIQHPDIRTKAPNKLHSLQKEIEWVQSSSKAYIDSDFFQPGVIQREKKVTYLTKLQGELLKLQKDRGKKKDDSPYSDVSNVNHGESEIPDRREQNFHYRIKVLQSQIEDCKTSIEKNLTTRALIARKLVHIQENVQSFRKELNRISEVDDEYVNSHTLHAAEQKFRTVELRDALQTKLDEELALIEMWKTDIIDQDHSNLKVATLIEKKEEQLRDRQAALLIFKKQRDSSSHLQMQTSRRPMDILRHSFKTWFLSTRKTRGIRSAFQYIQFLRCRLMMHGAFSAWRVNVRYQLKMQELMKEKSNITSKGGMLLLEAELAGMNVYKDIKSVMQDLRRNSIERNGSDNYVQGKGQLSDPDKKLFPLVRGDYHFELAEYRPALKCYKSALQALFATTNGPTSKTAQMRCALMDKIGRSLVHLDSLNEAILNYDSLLKIGNELNDERSTMIANLRLGDCYYLTGDLLTAKKQYIRCLSHGMPKSHADIQELANRAIQACQKPDTSFLPSVRMMEDTCRKIFDRKIFQTVKEGHARAELLQAQIGNTTTVAGYTITMEQASCKCTRARNAYLRLNQDIADKKEELSHVRKELNRLPQLISNINTELCAPLDQGGEGNRRTSSLVHDNVQNFEENELLQRLQVRLNESTEDLQNARTKDQMLTVQIRNMQDEMDVIQEDLRLEKSDLVQRNLNKRSIRLMEFDRLFISGDNDKCTQPQKLLIALTIDKDLYIHDAMSGEALQAFEGDTISDVLNQSTGHTAIITSLFFQGALVFTGSFDKTLRCWNLDGNRLQYIAKGHESTITSICATTSSVFSGSADRAIFNWNKKTGQMLHRLVGHSRGILTICKGPVEIVSGDGDGEIFVWNEDLSIKHRLELQPKNRVTVVKSGKLEVISGDHAGYVTIFWLKTETIIQQCKAHDTSVVDLEFDATKIVSCGMDGCVKVIDVTSCEIIHSIRGQDGPILSCRFDEDKIVTLTKDGQVRHWMWQSRVDPYKNGETYHRISSGETVASIATFYGIPIVNLVKWNVNQDMKKIHVGQRLIVSKTQQGNSTTTEYAQSTKSGPNRITSDASFLPSSKLHGHRMRPNPAEDTSKKTAMTEIKTGPENIHDIRCEKTLVGSRLARSEFNGY